MAPCHVDESKSTFTLISLRSRVALPFQNGCCNLFSLSIFSLNAFVCVCFCVCVCFFFSLPVVLCCLSCNSLSLCFPVFQQPPPPHSLYILFTRFSACILFVLLLFCIFVVPHVMKKVFFLLSFDN